MSFCSQKMFHKASAIHFCHGASREEYANRRPWNYSFYNWQLSILS